jgi:5-(carboxyamino)imidazole ribonucleotide mutase
MAATTEPSAAHRIGQNGSSIGCAAPANAVQPAPTRGVSVATSSANTTGKPLVGILTGSPNDLSVVEKAQDVLQSLGITSELLVLSAHRTPERVTEYVQNAPKRGIELFIACAGMAAHLAGAVAAQTLLPVIGVPLSAGELSGLDALLATVQMPPGIPVATVAVDGARNAGYLAARFLAVTRPEIAAKLEADLNEQRKRYDFPDKPRVR